MKILNFFALRLRASLLSKIADLKREGIINIMKQTDRIKKLKPKIIKAYQRGEKMKSIALELGTTASTVKVVLVKSGVFISKIKKWTPDDIKYLVDNFQNKSNIELKAYFNIGPGCLNNKMKSLKLKRIYSDPVDLDLFYNITKPEVAYFLGYFWADGSLRCRINTPIMTIQKEDALEIQDLIHSFGKVHQYEYERSQENYKDKISFVLQSRGLYKFLYENDFYEKSTKSPTKILDKIPESIQHYFWRGFLDGDGSIVPGKVGQVGAVCFAGSFAQDWSDLENLFKSLNIPTYEISRFTNNDGGRGSMVRLNKKVNLCKLLMYIYKGRDLDSIGLSRKYNKFLEFIEKVKMSIDNKICIFFNRRKRNRFNPFRVQVEGDNVHSPAKSFNNFAEAMAYKVSLNKKYNTAEYQLRGILNYHTYERQEEIFKERIKITLSQTP